MYQKRPNKICHIHSRPTDTTTTCLQATADVTTTACTDTVLWSAETDPAKPAATMYHTPAFTRHEISRLQHCLEWVCSLHSHNSLQTVLYPIHTTLTDIARGPFCCRRRRLECLCRWCADTVRWCRGSSAPRRNSLDLWCCTRPRTRAPTSDTGLDSCARYPAANIAKTPLISLRSHTLSQWLRYISAKKPSVFLLRFVRFLVCLFFVCISVSQ